jgi:hypothetical protein
MGLVKGLGNIKKAAEGRGGAFLRLKDGESARIRFLQELDEDSPGYNPEAGLGFLAVEYRDPDDFRKRALDTSDEGGCWMAEQGWKPRTSLYINVLNEDTGEVNVLTQGMGPKSVVPWLIEYAGDQGTLTNRAFKIKRTGSGMTDTQYTLTPTGPEDKEPFDVTAYELIDLEKVLNNVPYEQQENYFRGSDASSERTTDSAGW